MARLITMRWFQKTHLLRPDELICPACGARADKPYKKCPKCGVKLGGHVCDSSWVDETEGLSAMMDEEFI